MRLMPTVAILAAFLALAGVPVVATAQQNLFGPRILVDDQAVTNYEHQQRQRFMQLLNVPGDLVKQAEDSLIDDRLRMKAASLQGIRPTDAQILEGMAEFAARGDLTAEEFIALLEQNGVAGETFRDFVRAGLVWREVVRNRFVSRVRNVSEAEVDRALSLEAQRGTVRVLLSEIILPATARVQASELSQSLRGEAAFARAAREFSVAESAARGGQLEWVPVPNLPGPLAAQLGGLQPGQVTSPISGPGGIALYLLRSVEQLPTITPRTTAVEYAQYLIPGAGTESAQIEATRVRANVDACGDLYRIARGLPEERLTVETRPLSEVPAEIATELARLDAGESSTRLSRGGAQVFLMLCSRRVASGLPPDRDAIRERLVGERLEGHARIYLEELRANANIRRP